MRIAEIRCFGIKSILFIGAIAAGILGCTPKPIDEITEDELKSHLFYLASDELAGREIGSEGIFLAEEYIAERFSEYGLSPLPGDDDFFMNFDLYGESYDSGKTTLSILSNNEKFNAILGIDFKPFSFSDNGEVKGQIVFAGYGITAPEYGYDDYENLQAEGKIVLIMRHEPDEIDSQSVFDGDRHTRHAFFETKAKNAAKHGAIGMLLFTDPLHHNEPDDLRKSVIVNLDKREIDSAHKALAVSNPFVAFHISRKIAAEIVKQSLPDSDLSKLQLRIDAGEKASQIVLSPISAALAVGMIKETKLIPARNVAGMLKGTDPKLRDQWIVVGAHHDHVGSFVGDGDTIFNGADDNASGTSSLLELAEKYASLKDGPRRSIVFITFSAEEQGLWGARALEAKNLVDLQKVVFMLNIDMIGRNPDKPLIIYGDGYSSGMKSLIEEKNATYELPLLFSGRKYEPASDDYIFYQSKIPFIMLFTGEHSDYHGTGDHADKISYDRIEKISQLAYDILEEVSQAEEPPQFIP
jgi:aminopeptidase YwaD